MQGSRSHKKSETHPHRFFFQNPYIKAQQRCNRPNRTSIVGLRAFIRQCFRSFAYSFLSCRWRCTVSPRLASLSAQVKTLQNSSEARSTTIRYGNCFSIIYHPMNRYSPLNRSWSSRKIQARLEDVTGQRTVPNIFISQDHVGGNAEVQGLNAMGRLEVMLLEATARHEL